MRILCLLLLIIIKIQLFAQNSEKTLVNLVNPFIGTGGHGHTYPGATTPFGMVQLSPDTGVEGWDWCSGYHYSDSSIMGFSHTHLSGTGLPDLADVLLMPTVGEVKIVPGSKENPDEGYRSRFSHQNENASAGYYSVLLDDYNIKAELTATAHCGVHQYTFPESNESNIIIDLHHGLHKRVMKAGLKIEDSQTISGYRVSTGWADVQPVFFVMKFSKPFETYGTAINDNLEWEQPDMRSGHVGEANIKGVVRFKTKQNEKITVAVALSAVSVDNAKMNLESEIASLNFDPIKSQTQQVWEKELSAFSIKGNHDDKVTFYTALYHAMLAPNQIADIDGSFVGPQGKITLSVDKKYYSTYSLWDTYRAAHPLYTILFPNRVGPMVNSMLLHHEQWGYLPIWSLWGQETHVMIANHAIPVIVDAYHKGIQGFDYEKAYEAIKTSSLYSHFKCPYYLIDSLGYVPNSMWENVSILLEISYNDWCVAQMAKALGKTDDYEYFINRSQNYKNIFDKSTGYMRGRDSEGNWTTPFDPEALVRKGDYTEGNAMQYTWYVPHDVEGLKTLMGGADNFTSKLDELFESERTDEGKVHDVTGFIGQYAQGNEPGHHIAYLYNVSNEPWKTQKYINQICNTMYANAPDGLAGNEDCGQMSSWYVFSSLGFYPVNPANGIYWIGTPRFESAKIKVGNEKEFVIEAKNVSAKNFYIQSIKLNGKNLSKLFISHQDIMNGGKLEFVMSSKPNKKWAK